MVINYLSASSFKNQKILHKIINYLKILILKRFLYSHENVRILTGTNFLVIMLIYS